jgi:uncharacterized Zn-finger protein
MVPFETVEIDEMVAACSGNGGPLGHPRVFLNLAPSGQVECPYCSRLFINRQMAGQAGHASASAHGSDADPSPPSQP